MSEFYLGNRTSNPIWGSYGVLAKWGSCALHHHTITAYRGREGETGHRWMLVICFIKPSAASPPPPPSSSSEYPRYVGAGLELPRSEIFLPLSEFALRLICNLYIGWVIRASIYYNNLNRILYMSKITATPCVSENVRCYSFMVETVWSRVQIPMRWIF
jgi:hypothetical protein